VLKRIIVAAFLLLALAACSTSQKAETKTQQEAYWLDGKWAYEKSDLPPNDKALYGRLDNGFRYIIQKNDLPEDRVGVYLSVQAGSFMEDDTELGLAHYLEHMAFNGSENFPPGELISFFQKNGMSFGQDANAYTSYGETVYMLNLASADEENMKQAFLFMGDVAGSLSILEEEVEKERGVILSELAARDSEDQRAGLRLRKAVFGDGKYADAVIGTKEIIENATAKQLRRFYDDWYRPEFMVLMVVGDVEPEKVEQLIKERFVSVQARAERRDMAWWGDLNLSGLMPYYDNYKAESTNVIIEALHPRGWKEDTLEGRKQALLEKMASRIFTGRLEAIKAKGGAPFLSAAAERGETFRLFPYASVSADCEGDKWRETLQVLQTELKRIKEHGFLPEEVEDVRKEWLRQNELHIDREENAIHHGILMKMIHSINGGNVYLSATQSNAMYASMLAKVTPDDVYKAFLAMWNSGNHFVGVMGNAVIEGDGEAVIAKQWQEGKSIKVASLAPEKKLEYPYVPEPKDVGSFAPFKTQVITGKDESEQLVLYDTTFANGLRLRMIPTPFKKGEVDVNLLIGGGVDSVSDADFDSYMAAAGVNALSGFGRLSNKEQHKIFRMEGFYVRSGMGSHNFSLQAGGRVKDMEAILRAMWTQFKDPVVEERDYNQFISKLAMFDARRTKDVPSVTQDRLIRFVKGDSIRTAPFNAERAKAVSLEKVQEVLFDIMNSGSATMLLVGDVDPEEAARMVGRFFGAPEVAWGKNSPRKFGHVAAFPDTSDPAQALQTVSVESSLNQTDLVVAFERKVEDMTNRKALMVNEIVADILEDRLLKILREELGASYSPYATYLVEEDTGFGFYLSRISTQPDKLDMLRKALDKALSDFVESGVTLDELERMRRPLLNAWEQARQDNSHYKSMLTDATKYDLPYFRWNTEFPELIKSITVADLNAELKSSFVKENRAVLIVAEERTSN